LFRGFLGPAKLPGRERGIDAPYIRFRDEGRGWTRLSNRLFYFRLEAQFMAEQLGLK
jgi:hypothetical protein